MLSTRGKALFGRFWLAVLAFAFAAVVLPAAQAWADEAGAERGMGTAEAEGQAFKLEISLPWDNATFYIPTSGALDDNRSKRIDWTIAWGDGQAEDYSGTQSNDGIGHPYARQGSYTITITPKAGTSTDAWLAAFGCDFFGNGLANTVRNKSFIKGVSGDTPLTPSMTRTAEQLESGTAPSYEWAYLFSGCSNFTKTPTIAGWEGIQRAGLWFAYNMFRGCGMLSKVSDGFNLPQDMAVVGTSFANNMFMYCGNLDSLPADFNLPPNISSAGGSFASAMFYGCTYFPSLPEGFNLPQGMTRAGSYFAAAMFYECASLTGLPKAFNLPPGIATAEWAFAADMFKGAGGNTFQLNEAFTFPRGVSTGVTYVLREALCLSPQAPVQNRTAESIIGDCATPNENRTTFDGHFRDLPYIPVNWGGQGLPKTALDAPALGAEPAARTLQSVTLAAPAPSGQDAEAEIRFRMASGATTPEDGSGRWGAWQASSTFSGLSADTSYWFQARYAARHPGFSDSEPSAAVQAKTLIPVTKPAATATGLVYNGKAQGAGIATHAAYAVSGDRQVAAGGYTAKVVLRDKARYAWQDGTSADLGIAWTIAKARLVAGYRGEAVAAGTPPALKVEVTGFVNGETAGTAAGYVPPSVRAPARLTAGSYSLLPAGGAAQNYRFEYEGGLLVVKAAPLPAKTDIAGSSVAAIADQAFTGKAIVPAVRVTLGSKVLVRGRDYTVVYRNNIEAGSATLIISGKGPYTGTKTASFRIVDVSPPASTGFLDVDEEVEAARANGGRVWYVHDDGGYLDYVVSRGIMTGYADGSRNFGPYDDITRGQVAVVLYRTATGKTAKTTDNGVVTGFADTPSGQYYSAAVRWAAREGVVTGYKDENGSYTDFGPDDPVTREQLATMIARYAKTQAGVDISKASDSKLKRLEGASDVSLWARGGVAWCTDNGVIGGIDNGDGSFSMAPKSPAWRASMAKIMTVTLRDVLPR